MSTQKTMTEVLEINGPELAGKCAKATTFLLESKLLGGKTHEDFAEMVSESFSPNEMLFLAIGYIADRTQNIMESDPEIEKIINKAQAKHGVPDEMADIIKDVLGVKKK